MKNKNSIIKTIIYIVVILSVSACTTIPAPSAFKLKSGARIGIVSDLDEAIMHKHYVGPNEKINKLMTDKSWELNNYLHSEFKKELSRNGFDYVRLTRHQIDAAGVRTQSLFEAVDGKWVLLDDAQSSLEYFRDELGLDAVVSFKPSVYRVYDKCNAWGCTEHTIENSGYYSATYLLSFFGVEYSNAVLPFQKDIVILDPPTTIVEGEFQGTPDGGSLLGIFSSRPNPHATRIKKFKPKDIKNLSDSEVEKIQSEIMSLIVKNVKREVSLLVEGVSDAAK